MGIQRLVRDYYTEWQLHGGRWGMPTLPDCLDFMMTEVAEAIDLRLRTMPVYIRNNPSNRPQPSDIATEIFDAIMMGCIALDILGFDLMEVAEAKLEKMDRKRMG